MGDALPADEQLVAFPLLLALWLVLPPAPPVAELLASPELPAFAVHALLLELLLEVQFAVPSL